MCGWLDQGDFVANDMCCTCGGGYTATETVTEEETTTDDSSTTADSCVNLDNGLLNSYGYDCAWHETSGYDMECPYANTDFFDAGVLCCACGGGSTGAEEYVEDVVTGECVNLDNTALTNS